MSRERLPGLRSGATRTFRLKISENNEQTGGKITRDVEFDVSANVYPDGRVGELFITGDKMGEFIRGSLDVFAMAASIALQHGAPLQSITSKLRHSQFGPSGYTGDGQFRSYSSLFDLIAQWLDYKFPSGRLCPDPSGHAALANRDKPCPHCEPEKT